MKKVLALTLLSLTFASSYASAATTITNNTVPVDPAISIYGGNSAQNAADAKSPLVKLSAKVSAIVNWEQAKANEGISLSYAIGTKHIDGSKIFGTASDSTTIFFKQDASATVLDAGKFGTGLGNVNFMPAGWTAY